MALLTMQSRSRTHWRIVGVLLAAAVYVAAWLGWKLGWTWVTTPDASALAVAHRLAVEQRGWVLTWNVLCTMFSPTVFRLLTLGLVVFALARRERRVAVFLFVSVELSAVVTEIAKYLADRPRPHTAMVHTFGTSFPSGHALGSIVAVLALATVLSPYLRRSLWPWAIGAGVLVVVLVGVGRVALNVHHPSDVIAGWALGYLYFTLCVAVLRPRDPVTARAETPAAPGTAR